MKKKRWTRQLETFKAVGNVWWEKKVTICSKSGREDYPTTGVARGDPQSCIQTLAHDGNLT
jgi:hypothetical protein